MDEELKNNNQNKKGVFNTSLLVIVLLSISVMIFGVLCIYNSAVLFLKNNPFLFSVLVCLFCVIIDGVCVWLIKQKKEKILKSIIGIFAFAVICLVLLFILQVTGFIKIIKDQQKLQAYIQQTGAWMPIVFIVLQYKEKRLKKSSREGKLWKKFTKFSQLKFIEYCYGILLASFQFLF